MEGPLVGVRAAICSEHGSLDTVRIEERPAPTLSAGQLRVRVSAASINFPDVLLIANEYQIKVPVPFVPGSEFAGVVTELGAGVTNRNIGDRVFGAALVGAFAEEIVVDSASVSAIPVGVSDRDAAAFGVAHRTAYHVLRSVAGVAAGDEVVVLGAAGGVGLASVQLVSLLGASVTAVASSPERLAVAKACAARHLVDSRAGDLRRALREALPNGSDVVVDPVGGELSEPALRSLRYGGRFVTVGYASGVIPKIPLNLVLLKGARILGFEFLTFAMNESAEFERNERELMDLLGAGRIAPHVGATFALDDVADALRYVADRRAIGKVVIEIG